MSNYCRGGHSKYSLKVHLIFVTKYRKKIFNYKNIDEDVKQFFYDVSTKYHYKIIQMETDKDHIHILLEYNPNDKISEIVKYLKQYTTYMIWNKYSNVLSKFYWKRKNLWSDGYFACSIGQVSQNIIEKYIATQG